MVKGTSKFRREKQRLAYATVVLDVLGSILGVGLKVSFGFSYNKFLVTIRSMEVGVLREHVKLSVHMLQSLLGS